MSNKQDTHTLEEKYEEKYEEMFQKWSSTEGIEFVDAAAEERYKKALMRFKDVLQLRVPDRVPYMPIFEMFPAYYQGLTVEEAMYDYEKINKAWKQTILDTDPDLYINPILAYPGKALDALDYKLMKWPTNGLGPNQMYQFVEGEYMKADEYDEFLFDPTDYMLRKYYPRVFGILEPFKQLGPFHNGIWLGMLGFAAGFSSPGVGQAFEALVEAGKKMLDWFISLGTFDAEMKALGYPNMVGGMSFAPFDLIGDTMRGTKGIMLDMYRQPDKLLEAIDKATEIAIDMGVSSGKAANNPMVWMFLHKGSDGFMSDEQFKTFYWPSLRRLIEGLIEEGLTPCVYTEGDYTSRLKYLAEVPKGRVYYHFETVDMYKAKEILGDVACITGSVPLAVLATGTVDDVKNYCKQFIDVVGKGGGLIIDCDALDEAKPENVLAMGEFVREYGVYEK
jgi:hypothetical protein